MQVRSTPPVPICTRGEVIRAGTPHTISNPLVPPSAPRSLEHPVDRPERMLHDQRKSSRKTTYLVSTAGSNDTETGADTTKICPAVACVTCL